MIIIQEQQQYLNCNLERFYSVFAVPRLNQILMKLIYTFLIFLFGMIKKKKQQESEQGRE